VLRPQPLDDEHLWSWLIRLVGAYGVQVRLFARVLLSMKGLDLGSIGSRGRPLRLLIERLAGGTGVARSRLYRMVRPEVLAPRDTDDDEVSSWFWPYSVFSQPIAYCPNCFHEDRTAYLRHWWCFHFAVVCTKHGTRLVDRCPHCRSFLALASYDGIGGLETCAVCGSRLGAAMAPPAEGSVVALSQAIHAGLKSGRVSFGDLVNVPTRQIFGILRLTLLLVGTSGVGIKRPRPWQLPRDWTLAGLPIGDRYSLMGLASYALSNVLKTYGALWPRPLGVSGFRAAKAPDSLQIRSWDLLALLGEMYRYLRPDVVSALRDRHVFMKLETLMSQRYEVGGGLVLKEPHDPLEWPRNRLRDVSADERHFVLLRRKRGADPWPAPDISFIREESQPTYPAAYRYVLRKWGKLYLAADARGRNALIGRYARQLADGSRRRRARIEAMEKEEPYEKR
jgi:hypothetical protein